MTKQEKHRRRNISRKYKIATEEKESLEKNPQCDGNDWCCDHCKRQVKGCGIKPFMPRYPSNEYPPRACGTDEFECDGYL